jgi:hypothetical protein
MKLQTTHIPLNEHFRPQSLSWQGDQLIDWINGQRFHSNGEIERAYPTYTYRFDAA